MIYKAAKTYTLQKDLKVRKGPGTNYAQKQFTELTQAGKSMAYIKKFAVLRAGSKVTCMKVIDNDKEIWLRIPDGYILAQSEKEIYVC